MWNERSTLHENSNFQCKVIEVNYLFMEDQFDLQLCYMKNYNMKIGTFSREKRIKLGLKSG